MALSIESEKNEEKSSIITEVPAKDVEENSLKIENFESCQTVFKDEPEDENVIQEMLMDELPANNQTMEGVERNQEFPENREIQRIKENPNRRRSLRTEQASGRKIKPPKYDEIFNCYKRKEYRECIIYLDLVSETTKDCIEYQILKATCLVNLCMKLPEAHRILDEILKQRPDNVYCLYAKGLACYQECRWTESINFFNKAIAIDPKSMARAETLKNHAQAELDNEKSDEESGSEQMEVDNVVMNEENQSSNESHKRFACDLCGKRFGKKFNLDRHNKALHNRETPYIPPLARSHGRKSAPAKIQDEIKIKKEQDSEEIVVKVEVPTASSSHTTPNTSPAKSIDEKPLKINIFGKKKKKKAKKTEALPNGMARCNICRKVYSRGSLARHQIIHTGQKQFECNQCGKAFYQKSDLQRHETIHSDVFDYECTECDKKFRIKKNLQVHNKRHHSK